MQLPANVYEKALKDGSRVQALATHMAEQDAVSDSWLGPGPASVVVAIGEREGVMVNPRISRYCV